MYTIKQEDNRLFKNEEPVQYDHKFSSPGLIIRIPPGTSFQTLAGIDGYDFSTISSLDVELRRLPGYLSSSDEPVCQTVDLAHIPKTLCHVKMLWFRTGISKEIRLVNTTGVVFPRVSYLDVAGTVDLSVLNSMPLLDRIATDFDNDLILNLDHYRTIHYVSVHRLPIVTESEQPFTITIPLICPRIIAIDFSACRRVINQPALFDVQTESPRQIYPTVFIRTHNLLSICWSSVNLIFLRNSVFTSLKTIVMCDNMTTSSDPIEDFGVDPLETVPIEEVMANLKTIRLSSLTRFVGERIVNHIQNINTLRSISIYNVDVDTMILPNTPRLEFLCVDKTNIKCIDCKGKQIDDILIDDNIELLNRPHD
jgi:hypothetical protein